MAFEDRGKDEQVEHRKFLGQWNYSVQYSNSKHIDIKHLLKPIGLYNRVNPNVNHELLVNNKVSIFIYQV